MLNYILYLLGEFLALSLPVKWSYLIAQALSSLQCAVSKKDRENVFNNLKAIFPGKEDKELIKITTDVFINFGWYLVDFFRFSKIDSEFIKRNVVFENLNAIDEALLRKKGLIIVAAHLGNWELGGAVMGMLGYKVNAVALPHKHKRIDDFFNLRRESKKVRVIPLGRAVKNCIEAFERNEIVFLLGDRDFTSSGLTVNFFARPSILPKGPAAFSLRYDVPLAVGYAVREGRQGLRIVFSSPINFNPSGNYEQDIINLTELYAGRIEECVKKYPGQWYYFRQFWIV